MVFGLSLGFSNKYDLFSIFCKETLHAQVAVEVCLFNLIKQKLNPLISY